MHRTLLLLTLIVVDGSNAARAQSPEQWKLEPVSSMGGADASDDRYVFDRVTEDALAARASGGLFVLDVQGKRLLEYDGAGRHVRTLGRAGDGPGEFRFPTAIAVGAGDSIWVFDVGRVTVFPPAGGVPRTLPASTRTFGQLRIGGGAILRALAATPGPGGSGSLIPTRMHLARFSADVVLRDTLWSGPLPDRVLVTLQSGNSRVSTHATEQFGMTMRWDQLRDGNLVIADTSAYLLRIVSLSGQVLQTIGTREPGRRVTSADRERALERLRAVQKASASRPDPPPAALLREQLERTPFAAVVPRITGVRVDPRDRIWVGISGVRQDLERIDIYDRSGQLVARIASPPGMPAVLYGDGLAAILDRDEFDAQRVRIMRVATP